MPWMECYQKVNRRGYFYSGFKSMKKNKQFAEFIPLMTKFIRELKILNILRSVESMKAKSFY